MNFGQTGLERDTFEYSQNSVNRYTTEDYISRSMKSNPRIREILRQNGMSGKINMNNLRDLLGAHAKDTQNIANGIVENLPIALKYSVNKKSLEDACYLHDLGKALIPDEILNKPARLTPEEEKIMHTHSELSYELLKNSNIDNRTLNLIKYHHQNAIGSGYPAVGNDFKADIDLQVLSTADKYSALTEKRPNKEPMLTEKALGIIYQDVKDGKISPMVFKALVSYVRKENTAMQKISA